MRFYEKSINSTDASERNKDNGTGLGFVLSIVSMGIFNS